ncbi:hypothetical protein SJI19_24125 [Acerihabitans sp. TG2]|nr:hypothetical protein [Acerihabitans sp. TG2]MEA9393574.1 hypothetical protein [Acerihabitans sp. TG2]
MFGAEGKPGTGVALCPTPDCDANGGGARHNADYTLTAVLAGLT